MLVLVQMMYSISSEYGFWKVKLLVRISNHSLFFIRKRYMTERTWPFNFNTCTRKENSFGSYFNLIRISIRSREGNYCDSYIFLSHNNALLAQSLNDLPPITLIIYISWHSTHFTPQRLYIIRPNSWWQAWKWPQGCWQRGVGAIEHALISTRSSVF